MIQDGEFYTAIGPDGKEIILRRYLNDQVIISRESKGFGQSQDLIFNS